MEEILRSAPEQAKHRTGDNETPLELAVAADNPISRIVQLLLDAGADLEGYGTREGPLALAVQASKPQAAIINLLLRAGAQGFVTVEGQYSFETPFGHVIRFSDDPELVEAFLRTGKLEPTPAEAAEYLEDSVGRRWAFERMLAYGVPLKNAPGVFGQVIDRGTSGDMRDILERSASFEGEQWREEAAKALQSAVYHCRFEMATLLIARADAGAIAGSPGGKLVRDMSERR